MTIQTPPTDERSEISVLALLMATGQAYRVSERLVADDFAIHSHRIVYQAMQEIDKTDSALDVNTLHTQCKRLDPEWDDWNFLRDLQTQAKRDHAKTQNLELYADIVADKSLQRKYLAASHRVADGICSGELNDLDVDVFVDSQYRDLAEVALRREAEIKPLSSDEYEYLSQPVATVTSGYSDVDKYTNGLCAPDLFVMTGPSGTGKTTLAMNMAANIAKRGKVSAIFSMEMSRQQLTQRLIASEGRLPLSAVRQGRDDIATDAHNAYERIVDNQCMYIDDHSSRTVSEIKSQAMKVKHAAGRLDLVVVDYLGRMRPEDTRVNRNEQVGAMARGLKSIAKQMNVCVLCLAQLNRNDDIRDSGEVNHEADVILNLEREDQMVKATKCTTRKSRHAEPGVFYLTFQGQYNRFENHIGEVEYASEARVL